MLPQIVGIASAFLMSVAFANLLPKEDYGVYKYIISIGSIIGALSLTGLGTAVTQSVAKGFDGALIHGVKTSLKWSSGVIAISLIGSAYYLWRGNSTLGLGLLLIALINPLISSLSLYSSFLNGKKDFKSLGTFGMLSNSLPAVFLFLTLILTKKIPIIMSVYFISTALAIFINFMMTRKKYSPDNKRDPGMVSYAKHISLMEVLYGVADQIDRVILFKFFGGAELAIYTFATGIPTQLGGLLRNIKTLAFPKYVNLDKYQVFKSLNSKLWQLIIVTSFMVTGYILAAPLIFKIFFPKYLESIFLSQIYALSIIPATISILPATFLEAHKAKRFMYMHRIFSPVTRIILFIIFGYFYGAIGVIAAMVITKSLSFIFLQLLSRRFAHMPNTN